jgi:hypothetical protein
MGLVTVDSFKEKFSLLWWSLCSEKKRLLDQSNDCWNNMEKSLTREYNLVEGHYTDRMWSLILGDKNIEYAQTIDDFVVPLINETSRCIGRPEIILVPKTM